MTRVGSSRNATERRVLDGRYRLDERVGAGGMAEVWRARDLRLDRDVAVKLLPACAPGAGSQRRKLEREARALAAANHPNIVAVYDYGEAPGADDSEICPYLVMELVAGPDLHRYLTDRGPLPIAEALTLMNGLLDAVAHAHRAGVVHGDLKPANVFMSEHGPKVGDFGVARILDEETGATTIAATPSFAAPEVLKGERATPRSDVYSAACLAYELLAGKPPFEGANAWDVASKHIEGPIPRVRKQRSDVPSDIDAAIAKAMDKNPKRRFEDADAFAVALGHTPTVPADATVPVAASGDEPEKTTALTQPRPNIAAIAVAGPFARIWQRIGTRARSSPRGRAALLLIPLLLLIAWMAMRGPSAQASLVPDVVGDQYQTAGKELQAKGFRIDVSFRPITEGTPGRVLRTVPEARQEIAPGGEILMIVSALAPTPEPSVVPAANDEDGDAEPAPPSKAERRRAGKNKRD